MDNIIKKKTNIVIRIIPILVIVAVILLDQISKKIIFDTFPTIQDKSTKVIHIFGDILTFKFTKNTGMIFGLFSDTASDIKNIVFPILTLLALSLVIYFYTNIKKERFFARICFGLYIGGAIGNFIDKIFGYIIFKGEWKLFYGGVVDFIDFQIKSIGFHWATFNVADISISVGIILYDAIRQNSR